MSRSPFGTFVPAQVFPLAETIADELAARGWTVEQLSDKSVMPLTRLREIMAGARLRVNDAERLAVGLGIDSLLLLRMDYVWRKYPDRQDRSFFTATPEAPHA